LQQLSSNLGPYYPRKASKSFSDPLTSSFVGFGRAGVTVRPPKPQFQMFVIPLVGIFAFDDPVAMDAYRESLINYFDPYHKLVDRLCRLALDQGCMNPDLINLSLLVGTEAIKIGSPSFCQFWLDVADSDPHVAISNRREWALTTMANTSLFNNFCQILFEEERHALNQKVYSLETLQLEP